jgi:hypothetical protein
MAQTLTPPSSTPLTPEKAALTPLAKGLLIGFGVFAFIAIAVGVGLWYYFKNRTDDSDGPVDPPYVPPKPPPAFQGNFVDPRLFFSLESTEGMIGRNDHGDLFVNGELKENGIITREQALEYPLTPKIVPLPSESWEECVQRVAPGSILAPGETKIDQPGWTLVIEGKTDIWHFAGDLLRLKGLVIRHGACLLIAGDSPRIEAEFILVESGGLLQCGGKTATFRGNLEILMRANPLGAAKCGVVRSQYGYQWYNPGVIKDQDAPTGYPHFRDITGSEMLFQNAFNARVLAVGFCGTLALFGRCGQSTPIDYDGTWAARYALNKAPFFNNSDHFLTLGDDELPENYALTWTHLEEGSGVKGDGSIVLDASARAALAAGDSGWVPGAQVVITCVSEHWCEGGDVKPQTLGTPAMWLDYDPVNDKANHDANEATIIALAPPHDIGVEVATIQSVDAATGTLTLARSLYFNHAWDPVAGSGGGAVWFDVQGVNDHIQVDTRPHVGLLTRNIRIRAEYTNAPDSGGAFNRPSTAPREANPSDYDFRGGMRSIVPDFIPFSASGTYATIVENCYQRRDAALESDDPTSLEWQIAMRTVKTTAGDASDRSLYDKIEDTAPVGCWQLGTAGMQGANSILGAHCMFRYGSSVTLDSIEVKGMGVNGASGQIGQYCLHFHLMGWTHSFAEYLQPGDTVGRDASCSNSSIWSSASRVVALHGTNEAVLSNNISFLTYGTSWFTEEGVEILNTFDHQLVIATMVLRNSVYDNPSGLLPFTGFDFNAVSCAWLKNNRNKWVRNVTCNCPRPVVAIWPITQQIAVAHNLASVSPGDSVRLLPAIGSGWCVTGGPTPSRYALSQYGGHLLGGGWSPDSYELHGMTDSTNCGIGTGENVSPHLALSDNVGYGMAAFISEYISFYACIPLSLVEPISSGHTPCQDLAIQGRWSNDQNAPLWLPARGVNGSADQAVVASYMQCQWNGSSAIGDGFWPWTADQIDTFNGGPGLCCPGGACTGSTQGIVATNQPGSCSRCMPNVFSSCLAFGMAGFTGQMNTSVWTKAQSTQILNCCFLDYGNSKNISGMLFPESSTTTVLACGDNLKKYGMSYMQFHNLICNSRMELLPNPTSYSGDKTVIDVTTQFRHGEYISSLVTAVPDMYFAGGIDHTIIPAGTWASSGFIGPVVLRIFDEGTATQYTAGAGAVPGSASPWIITHTLKNPFFMEISGGRGQLLRYPNSATSNLGDMQHYLDANLKWGIPADKEIGLYHSPLQIATGDEICRVLAMIAPGPA